jgi:hypothetical protein
LTSAHQNNPKHIKLYQKTIKKNFEFFKNAVCTAFPNDVYKKKLSISLEGKKLWKTL